MANDDVRAKALAEAQHEHDTRVKDAKATFAQAGKDYRAARALYRKTVGDATTKLAVDTLKISNPELADMLDKAAAQDQATKDAESEGTEPKNDEDPDGEDDGDNGDDTSPAVSEQPTPTTRGRRNAA
jgi:hypothetical protein